MELVLLVLAVALWSSGCADDSADPEDADPWSQSVSRPVIGRRQFCAASTRPGAFGSRARCDRAGARRFNTERQLLTPERRSWISALRRGIGVVCDDMAGRPRTRRVFLILCRHLAGTSPSVI